MKGTQHFFQAIAVLLLCGTLSSAQAPVHRVVVKAGRLLDVKSGQMFRDQAIMIENDKIVSVGAAKDANITGATVVDLSQATVLPEMSRVHGEVRVRVDHS